MRKNQIRIQKSSDQNVFVGEILSISGKGGTARASVKIDGGNPMATNPDTPLDNVKFYYHCEPNNTDDGYTAFEIEHKVLIAKVGADNFIIGFEDLKPRQCISPRFFVKIKESGEGAGFRYYWLFLLNDEGDYEVTIKESIGGSIIEKMLTTPFNNGHTQTKAFMLDNEGNQERWVAAPHLLTKNRVQQFLPLHFPAEEEPPEKSPIYPTPALCGTPPEYGLAHYCPPNRFFCNPEEKIMVWFTVEEDTCICGVILNKEKDTTQTFLINSSDMDGEGFEAYWCVNKTGQEVPISTMIDVVKLTQNEIEIILPWQMRPTKVIINLNTSQITYEEVDSCNHQHWSDSGFNEVSLAQLTQSSEDHSGESEESVVDSIDCSVYGDQASCYADEYHVTEILGRYHVLDTTYVSKRHSDYELVILGNNYSVNSDLDKYDVSEHLKEILDHCGWQPPCQNRGGPGSLVDLWQNRKLKGHLNQKNVDSGVAELISPNVLYKKTSITKSYCDGLVEQRRNRVEAMTEAAFQDLCYWGLSPTPLPQSWRDLFTVGECFKEEMPGSIWNQFDNESFYGDVSWKVWERSTNQDEENITEIKKYSIDGVVEMDASKYNRIYYLDDRSTDESHGIIVAGKLYNKSPEEVYDWKIYWAKSETGYFDITADVLDVLEIEKEQLYEIGLI